MTDLEKTRRSGFSPRSLAFRVIAFSTIWAILALVVISTVISTLYRQTSERGFASLLNAHLFNLISSVGVTDGGILTGSPDLGDLRFSMPGSGWYWSVEPVSDGVKGRLRSGSMIGEVAAPPVGKVPFSSDFRRTYESTAESGETLEVVESEFELAQRGSPGDEVDRTAGCVAPVERALRTAQDFHPLDIGDLHGQSLAARHIDTVEVHRDARVLRQLRVVVAHAAHEYTQGSGVRRMRRELQVGHVRSQVGNRINALGLELPTVEGRQRDRRVLQGLLTLLRGNDDFLQRGLRTQVWRG